MLQTEVRRNRFAKRLVIDAVAGSLGIADGRGRAALRRWFTTTDDPAMVPASPQALERFLRVDHKESLETEDDDVFSFFSKPVSSSPPLPSSWADLGDGTIICPPASLEIYPLLSSLPSSVIDEAEQWIISIAKTPLLSSVRRTFLSYCPLLCSLLFSYADSLRFHLTGLLLLAAGRPASLSRTLASAMYSAHLDLQHWAPSLGPLTAASSLYPLSPAEAQVLIDAHLRFLSGRYGSSADQAAADTAPLLSRLCSWADKVAAASPTRLFCRLSPRSPKDSAFADERFPAQENTQLKRMREMLALSPFEALPEPIASAAQHMAAAQLLAVENGRDVVRLLVCSRRAAQDAEESLSLCREEQEEEEEEENNIELFVVLREWKDAPIDTELRVFVRGGKVTAICPTFASCYFGNRSIEKWRRLGLLAVDLANRVIAAVPHRPDFVIDTAFDQNTNEAFVVELNAYGSLLGGTLFDWQQDEAVLRDGPLEFRVRTNIDGKIQTIPL